MSSIAIVGMACRFAGAKDLPGYWRMLCERRDGFGPVPPNRWNHEAFYDANRRKPDHSYAHQGAFIEDVWSFPALHLGIPPRRVEVMDPQQRFALEVAIAAIADSGRSPEDMAARTGVFLGVNSVEFREFVTSRISAQLMATGQFGEVPDDPDSLAQAVSHVRPLRPFSATGVLNNMNAAVVAQELDLRGPAYTVDAACASSLVAVVDAVAQLRAGTVDAALAGGVYLCLSPTNYLGFARIGAISESGYCRPFDHRADGFVQGDGVGVLVLRRLEDAVADGDRIYAVIEGTASNNDGRGDGPMAPSEAGQVEVIELAWKDSNIPLSDLGYIETHGTGTAVGDRVEFLGLQRVFGEAGPSAAIGSAKANVGHTMSAAGIAGLIRAALSIHHRTIPPMAGFEKTKDDIQVKESSFRIPTSAEPWNQNVRVAGVSSFGFGGTNAHCVLRQAPVRPQIDDQAHHLTLLSAGSEPHLRALAGQCADAMEMDPTVTVAAVARSAAAHTALSWRLALVADTPELLKQQLRDVANGDVPEGCTLGEAPETAPRIAFLFPGQGAQRTGMLADASTRFPIIAETLEELEQHLVDVTGTPLTHLLYPERRREPVDESVAAEELRDTARCQPTLYACHESLRRLLAQAGVHPFVSTGHSLGEFNAAVAGGMLSAKDAGRFVALRGAAMGSITGDRGTMAALMADAETTASFLVEGVVVANHNHPKQHVISGATEQVHACVQRAEAAGTQAKLLDVSHGFHSPCFSHLDVDAMVSDLTFTEGESKVVSAITGRAYANVEEAREVYRKHATSPVRFMQALTACHDEGADLFLQVGAGGPLASFARKVVGSKARAVLTLGSLDDQDGGRSILNTFGLLFVLGAPVNARGLTPPGTLTSLPPSPLPTERYWVVQDTPSRALHIFGGDGRAPKAVRAGPAVSEPDLTEQPDDAPDEQDSVMAQVIGLVARVSSYPKTAIKPTSTLIDDLGFDSLMVGDLATGLAEQFPGVPGLPQEMLINQPTILDLVAHVQNTRGGASSEEDDEKPLLDHRPVWRPTPLPDASPPLPSPLVATFEGPGAPQETPDAFALASSTDEAKLLIWIDSPHTTQAPRSLTEGSWQDPSTAFLARVSKLPNPTDMLVVYRTKDPSNGALLGAARSLSREWPHQRIKTLGLSEDQWPVNMGTLVAEAHSSDDSVNVRYAGEERQVMGLERLTEETPERVWGEEHVAITGGTRGIGWKLARHLREAGARVLLISRSTPSEEVTSWVKDQGGAAQTVQADVCDEPALTQALARAEVTGLVHAAGILADGAVASVDSDQGVLARKIKVEGWLQSWKACGDSLQWTLAIGSWAGRFGNRHQTHYGAANAAMASIAAHHEGPVHAAVAEFGPWTDSDMARTIPAPVRATMRAEGVDFTADIPGLEALLRDAGRRGVITHGRKLPLSTRSRTVRTVLSTKTHPFLLDHALDGTPVLPLAAALDTMVHVAGLAPPFEVVDLTLFRGVTVSEDTPIEVRVWGDRAELRVGPERALAYRATTGSSPAPAEELPPLQGGDPCPIDLESFYRDLTFHGPLLAGLVAIDGLFDEGARGQVQAGTPSDWIPKTTRKRWDADPLVVDSALQLAAMVAWVRYQRAGTPVSMGRYVQYRAMPKDRVTVDCTVGERDGDRFTADFTLRDPEGQIVARIEGAVAQLQTTEVPDSAPAVEFNPLWTEPSEWPEVKDLEMRLQAAAAMGIDNPYFSVHEGTAKDTTVVDGRELVNFSSYNYIGLSGDPRVLEAVHEAVERYGTSVSASRVASGERPFHIELEAELAQAQGVEDTLVFTAGHATNVTTIGHLLGPNDLVLHDELIHDSALQGIKLSGAGRRGYRHEDPEHLERLLKEMRHHHEKVLIVVEGVYSMDGDLCNLPAFLELKQRFGCLLMVDEAHSFGVVGKQGCGIAEHHGVNPKDVDLWMGTLSKSLASCGGWIGGSKSVINYLRYTAPGFVYSAGITPANGVAGLTSLRLMLEEPERVARLQANASIFHHALVEHGIDTGPALGGSAVIPAITGNSMHALVLSGQLLDEGINVQPIVYPAVADDAARLRFFLSSTHSTEQLQWTAERVAHCLTKVRETYPLP